MTKPLVWSLPGTALGAFNSYTFGQSMLTPSDILIEVPGNDELPYSALLFVNSTHITVNEAYADKISTTLGFVGPWALGEESQKFVHGITGSDEPQGWNTQIGNEIVFQLTRGRAWRSWTSSSQKMDLINSTELSLGTISSSVSVSSIFRYGSGLKETFVTPLLGSSRASNPIATTDSWYIYAGLNAGYIFNQIFTDGNTFKDSRSIESQRESIGFTLGITKAWKNFSFSFAINDSNLISDEDNDKLEDLTRFGSLTLAFRI